VIPSLWTILGDIILNITPELINALVCTSFIVINRYIYLASVPAAQAYRGGDLFNQDFFLLAFLIASIFGYFLVF
jgi:hypothetical protein